MELKTVRSQRWGYARIIVGTIAGGMLGFYFMHRLEISYKAKWDARLKKYEEEKLRKENVILDDEASSGVAAADASLLFSDDHSTSHQSN